MQSIRDRNDAFLQTRYFPSLDGLRCLSIVAVIWHHAAGASGGVLAKGYLGVNLFFAISGFLITTLLIREQGSQGTIDLGAFYARRTLRIFPLYYLVLALYTVLTLRIEPDSPAGAQFRANLPYFATYTSNWFVARDAGTRVIFYFAWSLATEEQFYAVWPSIIRFARAWYGPAIAAVLALVAHVAAGSAVAAGWIDGRLLAARIAASIAPAICFGCLAAIVLHRPAGLRFAQSLLGRRASAAAVGVLLAGCMAVDAVPQIAIEALMAVLVAACCLRRGGQLGTLLENRLVRHVGTVSYGMYLLHMLVINAVRRLLPDQGGVVVFAVALPLTALVATLSYESIEKHFLALKERFRARGSAAAAPAHRPERAAR